MRISETINDALIHLGILAPTEEATPEDHKFGLKTLNRIIDAYSLNSQLITHTECIEIPKPCNADCLMNNFNDSYVMTSSWKNPIEIGYFKDINMQSPIHITEMSFYEGDTCYPMRNMTEDKVSCCNLATGIPTRYHIQKMDENSTRIFFDIIPSDNLSLKMFAKMPYIGKTNFGEDYNPQDDIDWSFGFEKMLMYRLAIELAPSYGVQPSQTIFSLAKESEDNFMRANYKPQTLKLNKAWYR